MSTLQRRGEAAWPCPLFLTHCYLLSYLKDGASIALNRVVESYQNVDYVYHQVVEIFAEAIQSKPEEAVENSWKVTVTDRKITSVN